MIDVNVRKRYRNNEVVYEYRFELASVDGQRKWKTKSGFKSVAEARKAGRLALQQYENIGRLTSKEEISYADFLDYWLENDCAVDLNPVTLAKYKSRVKNVIKPYLGMYHLKSISREVLQAFILDLYDRGYAYNTISVVKGLLTKSFNYAEDHHYIVYSPAIRLKTPKNRVPKTPTRSAPHHFIPSDVMEKIFERFPERTSSFIPLKLGYECGLRIGEIFALCWEDVDFNNKTISINRQVQWYQDSDRQNVDKVKQNGTSACGNGCWYFAAPKYDSYRIIEISDELSELLLREQARQLKAKDYYGCYYTSYDVENPLTFDGKAPAYSPPINRIGSSGEGYPIHLVCIRENGTFISPRAMQHTSRVIKKEIFKNFDFHSMRHTHASMLAENEVEQKYIQTRLGHSNIDITIGVYEHTTDKMREKGRKAVNELYSHKPSG